jgi:hypothetical protein
MVVLGIEPAVELLRAILFIIDAVGEYNLYSVNTDF